jgi:hypothetical protein
MVPSLHLGQQIPNILFYLDIQMKEKGILKAGKKRQGKVRGILVPHDLMLLL